MRNMMVFFMFILCIYSICGMDSFSEDSDSSNALEKKHLTAGYIKQNLEFDNAYDQRNIFKGKSDVKNLSKISEENFDETNNLKRKHKSNKSRNDHLLYVDEHKYNGKYKHNVRGCEFCQKESTQYTTGKSSGKTLCKTCYDYESRYGYLVPLEERNKREVHKNILACEFCHKESKKYTQSKVNGKSLCQACYRYESLNGHLIPPDERRKCKMHKNILACEFCQQKSKKYKKSKITDKSLCDVCYRYESRHGCLLSIDQRKQNVKHKDHILACEFCHKESTRYTKSQVNDKSLCRSCYQYESKHGQLIPLDERRKNQNPVHILACDFCQKVSKRYVKSKVSKNTLCITCYQYESVHGHLIRPDERRKRKHYILVCEYCQKESKEYTTGKISGKSLCLICYMYELRYGRIVPLDERKQIKKHKDILVCECCQEECSRYTKGKISGKSLCLSCYKYEHRYGQLKLPNERKKYTYKNRILSCEICQKENTLFTKDKISDKFSCYECYKNEARFGYLDEQNKYEKHKNNAFVCESCQKKSTQYTTGKVSGKSLCHSCYMYEYHEYQYDRLVSSDEQEKYKKRIYKKPELNRLIDAEKFLNKKEDKIEEKNLCTKYTEENQIENTETPNYVKKV